MSEAKVLTADVAVLSSGGPAPGINGVLWGVVCEADRLGLSVAGVRDGFRWLECGDAKHAVPLTVAGVLPERFKGGSMLGMSRANPNKDDKKPGADGVQRTREEKLDNVLSVLRTMGVKYLVTIGGDDTALTALRVSEHLAGQVRVAHVPKTIDNDLPLPPGVPTFGFRTASAVGGELVGHLMADARTTGRWYVVVMMGRSAGHLALGTATAGGATLAVIPEEFGGRRDVSADEVCRLVEGGIFKSRLLGRGYGVAVIAEGVGELAAEDIRARYDGNPLVKFKRNINHDLRLAEVPLGPIFKRELQRRAAERGDAVKFVDITTGYELRCAPPNGFDVEYTEVLGGAAVRCVVEADGSGGPQRCAMVTREGLEVVLKDLAGLIGEDGKIEVRRVDMMSEQYAMLRSHMVRLEPGDLADGEQVARLAEAAGMKVEAFVAEYGGRESR